MDNKVGNVMYGELGPTTDLRILSKPESNYRKTQLHYTSKTYNS